MQSKCYLLGRKSLLPSGLGLKNPSQPWQQIGGLAKEGQMFRTQRCPETLPSPSPACSAQHQWCAAASQQSAAAVCTVPTLVFPSIAIVYLPHI